MLTFDKVAQINRVGAVRAAAVVSLHALAALPAALLVAVLVASVTGGAAAPAFAGPVTRMAVCETGTGCEGADVRMQGATNSDFGFTTVMGYLDNDGLADLVVGAPAEGRVYIFFGSVTNPDPDPNSPLLDVSAADVILSPDPATTASKLGFSAAVAPRRNAGDTNNPLLIGAPGADALRGAAYVIPASAWLTVGTWNTPGTAVPVTSVPGVVRIAGVNIGDEVGFSTAFGPVLTLGAEDFVLGARRSPSLSPAPARDQAGVIFVVGETAISPITLSGTTGVTIRRASGAVAEGGLGEQVVVADFLPAVGGGLHEIAASGVGVNPSEASNPPGRLYVFAIGADIDLAAGGANVRRIVGDSLNDFFGFSLSSGDFDNSGTVDLAAGAIYAETSINDRNAGAVYLFTNADLAGAAAGADPSMDPNAESESTLPTMRGARKWDVAGFSLATGDVNGDGVDDLAIGSRWHEKSLDINDVDAGLVSILQGSGPITWPTIIGCTSISPTPCSSTLPTDVDRMIFGNIFESGASDEMGYSVALGDFNRDAVFDDVAIGTVAHERVYLVSLNNADEAPATVTGQQTDTVRDIRDGDDDGDGYLDGEEDADDDGVLDALESDPEVPNKDGGVAFDAASPSSVTCDQTFTVTVNVANASPNLTIPAAQLRLRVTLPSEVTYQTGTAVCNGVNLGGGAFPLASFTQVSASSLAPATVVVCTFQLQVAADPDATSVSLTADLDATITDAIPDGHPGIAESADSATSMIALTCPDLLAAKAGPIGSVTAGTSGTLDYTINVDNIGGTAACASPRVVDTLPANVTCGTATGTGWVCSISAGSVTCNRGTALAVGASAAQIALDCTTAASVLPGAITNTATASCVGQNELDVDDSVATAMTTIITEATLSLAVSDSPDPVAALNAVVYTFAVANAGPSDAQALQLTITPPAGQANATPSGSGWICGPSGGDFLCTRSVLAPGSAPNVTMTTTVDKFQTTPITASGSLTWTTTNPSVRLAADSETTTVLTQADLGISKTDSPDPVDASANLTYTLSVSNAGGGTPANNITVIDTLPAGVTFVSAIGTGWICGQSAGVVTCTLTTLADGTSANDITIIVTADASTFGSISDTASVSALGNQDNVSGNDTDTESTIVNSVADLAIVKSDSVDPTGPGASLAYTLMVTNNGPGLANSVEVVDDLPGAGATKVAFVSGVGTGWTCVESPVGTVTCSLASLASGASSSVTINVTIDADTDGILTNTADVSALNNTDNVSGNDSASETTVVDTAADLSIVKSDSADPVAAGGTLTYTLTVDNLGPDSAGDVSVVDTLPSGVTFVSATGTNFSCVESPVGTVTCTRNSMPDGPGPQDITVVVTVGASTSGTISNSATISALNNSDNVAVNDNDTEPTTVSTTADLAIMKSDSVDPAAPGGALSYTLSVTNNGPGTVTGVTVVDTLPSEIVFVSGTGTDWSCVESPVGTVTCTLAVALAPGPASALTISTTVDAGAAGTQMNTASVTATNNTDGTGSNNSDSENTGLSTATDLELVKTDSADPRSPGDSLTYTLTVSNLGPEQAGDLTLTDTLPSEVTFVSAIGATWSCGHAAGVVTCTKNKLNASGMSTTTTVDIVVTVNASAAGTLSNSATIVAGNNADSNPSNNTAVETTVVTTAADLSITKTDSVDPATEDQNLTWTLTVTNNGTDSAADVTVTDVLPAGVTFVSATGTGWTCMNAAGTVTCVRGADLAASTSANPIALVVTVDVGTAGPLSNTATAAASNNTDGTPATDTEMTDVNTNAELAIVKTDSVDPAAVSGSLDYTLTVTNNGPSDAGVVTVVDTLPSGVTYVSGTGTGWTCPAAPAGPMITCTRASLADSTTAPDITISVTVDSTTAGTLSNTAVVSAADNTDTMSGNNSDTETTAVATAADLSITKTDSVDPATENQSLTWTLTVTNNGADSAAGVSVIDVLPAGVTFVSATGTGWTCVNVSGTVTCDLGSNLLASTSAGAISLVVTVDVGTAGPLSNTATAAASNNTDGTPATDTEATDVNSNAELAIVKTDSPDPAPAGGPFDYTLTVTNNGPSDAGVVTVVDTLPSGVTFSSAGGTGWACGHAAGIVTCTRASLTDSTTAPDITISVTVDSTTAGTLSNTAVVSAADNTDTMSGNNSDTETTDVATAADLSITMTDSPDPVDEGMSLTWTLTVTNNGADSAAGVTVTDVLPAGVTFVSATGTGWTCMNPSGTVTCDLAANLAAFTSANVIDIVVTVNLGMAGSISNTASVAALNNVDGTPANNSVTETTTATGMLLEEVTQVDMMLHGEVTWSPVAGAANYNLYRGDLSLLRTTGVYTQDTTRVLAAARFCGVTDMVQDDGYLPPLGQGVFYMVSADNGVTEGTLGTDSLGTPRSNDNPCN